MISKQNNQQIKENVQQIMKRTQTIQQTLHIWYQNIYYTQERCTEYWKNVTKDLITFQNQISRVNHSQSDKIATFLQFFCQYQEFPVKTQHFKEVSLELKKYQLQLRKKIESFQLEFRNYSTTLYDYNSTYQKYQSSCNNLNLNIKKFKSQNNLIEFYSKIIILNYQQKFEIALNNSKDQQIKIITKLQLVDSKRRFLEELIKQIRQCNTLFFHQCLKFIKQVFNSFVNLRKDKIESQNFNKTLFYPSGDPAFFKFLSFFSRQFNHLNTFESIIYEENEQMIDFIEVLKDKTSPKLNKVLEEHTLFSKKCDILKKSKKKFYEQNLQLHENLLEMISSQIENYRNFKKKLRVRVDQKNQNNNFENYFGQKAFQMHELCLQIIQTPQRVFQGIDLWIMENFNNFKRIIEEKRIALNTFNEFYSKMMNEHLKQKKLYEEEGSLENEIHYSYRSSLISHVNHLRFIYFQLEEKWQEQNKIIQEKLVHLHKFIVKQFNRLRIQVILDNNKEKIYSLSSFNVINEARKVFNSDSIYNVIYEDIFTESLAKSFGSKINQIQYDQVQAILRQKNESVRKMLKLEAGCCGIVKVQPLESEVLSTYKCYLDNDKNCPFGVLKILKKGLTFEELKWNPFAKNLFILIPNEDIRSIENKSILNTENKRGFKASVCIKTVKGSVGFMSSSFDELFNALQKIYGQTYRKSIVTEKNLGLSDVRKSDSTTYGSKVRNSNLTSMMVSYNKDRKVFVQQPLILQKMNSYNSMNFSELIENKRNSLDHSIGSPIKINSLKLIKSDIIHDNDRSLKKIHQKLQKFQVYFNKHKFLSDRFNFISTKLYRSDERKDYEMNDSQIHSKFILKELKKSGIIKNTSGEILEIVYEWKIAYPQNSALRSFKYGQKIIIDLNVKPPLLSITQQPHLKQSIFNRRFFYNELKIMNEMIRNYIVQSVGKQFCFEEIIQKQQNNFENDVSEQYLNDDFREERVDYLEEFKIRSSGSKIALHSWQNIHLGSQNFQNPIQKNKRY